MIKWKVSPWVPWIIALFFFWSDIAAWTVRFSFHLVPRTSVLVAGYVVQYYNFIATEYNITKFNIILFVWADAFIYKWYHWHCLLKLAWVRGRAIGRIKPQYARPLWYFSLSIPPDDLSQFRKRFLRVNR
jgi:hypothetical protein